MSAGDVSIDETTEASTVEDLKAANRSAGRTGEARKPAPDHGVSSPPIDLCRALRDAASTCASMESFYRSAFDLIVTTFDVPSGALRVDLRSGVVDDQVFRTSGDPEPWKQLCHSLLFKVASDGVPRARMVWSLEREHRFAAMAMPLGETCKAVSGALAIVVPCEQPALAEAKLRELRAIVSLTDTLAINIGSQQPVARNAGARHAVTSAARAASYQSLHEFSFAIVNNLKNKFGLEQVALGRVGRNRVRLLCISGFDDLYPRSPGTRHIEQAMEECVDAGHIVCYQTEVAWSGRSAATGHRIHRQWHDASGNAAVASIPIIDAGRCVAVLSLRHADGRPFDRSQLEKIEEMVTPLAGGLVLLERAERTLVRHVTDQLQGVVHGTLVRGAYVRKAALLAVMLFGLWLAFGTQSYQVSIPCEVVPSEVRHITAPFQGTLASAGVKPGDKVRAGTVIARFDTTDLQIELDRIESERRIAELDLARAMALHDVESAGRARARVAIAQSQADLIAWKIDRSVIRAPVDGVILDGKLAPRVGDVMDRGEPLVRMAPDNDWSVRIYAPEFAVVHLRKGQQGYFTTQARPDTSQAIVIERIGGSTDIVNGKNVFAVESRVRGGTPPWVRAGMRGVARVDTGRRAVWWVWAHRICDHIRLQLWKL